MISFGVLELLMRSRTLNLNCAAVNSGKNEKPPDGGDGHPGADEQSGRTCLSSQLELYRIMGYCPASHYSALKIKMSAVCCNLRQQP